MIIPCIVCPGCGMYNDFTVDVCECGRAVNNTKKDCYVMYDSTDQSFSDDRIGEIDEDLTVYMQTCGVCGAVSYTADKNKKVKTCRSCKKGRIANADVVPFTAEKEAAKAPSPAQIAIPDVSGTEEAPADSETPQILAAQQSIRSGAAKPAAAAEDDDDDDDEDDGDNRWGFLSGAAGAKSGSASQQGTAKPAAGAAAPAASSRFGADKVPVMTLSDVHTGGVQMSITSTMAATPILFGRENQLAAFLAWDTAVGRAHCYISFRNGKWYVLDNHSANGVFVNGVDIGLDGESELRSGDRLIFGHRPDSPTVIVRIE